MNGNRPAGEHRAVGRHAGGRGPEAQVDHRSQGQGHDAAGSGGGGGGQGGPHGDVGLVAAIVVHVVGVIAVVDHLSQPNEVVGVAMGGDDVVQGLRGRDAERLQVGNDLRGALALVAAVEQDGGAAGADDEHGLALLDVDVVDLERLPRQGRGKQGREQAGQNNAERFSDTEAVQGGRPPIIFEIKPTREYFYAFQALLEYHIFPPCKKKIN